MLHVTYFQPRLESTPSCCSSGYVLPMILAFHVLTWECCCRSLQDQIPCLEFLILLKDILFCPAIWDFFYIYLFFHCLLEACWWKKMVTKMFSTQLNDADTCIFIVRKDHPQKKKKNWGNVPGLNCILSAFTIAIQFVL